MRDYNYKEKWSKLLTPEIVKKLTLINEYKGEQRLFIEAHKDELIELVEIAKIQSTEASNRIEGIFTADDRIKSLVQAKTTPPSGTIHAHRPPIFNIRMNNARNNNSVFFVLQTLSKSPDTDSASRLPLNGGFANTKEYLSLSVF